MDKYSNYHPKPHYEYEKEFNRWKNPEDEDLRRLGWPEKRIQKLRKKDHHEIVDKQRSYDRKTVSYDNPNFPELFIASYDDQIIETYMDLVNSLDNEAAYKTLSKAKLKTQYIIMYLLIGFTYKEISELMNMKEAAVRKQTYRLGEKYNFYKKLSKND